MEKLRKMQAQYFSNAEGTLEGDFGKPLTEEKEVSVRKVDPELIEPPFSTPPTIRFNPKYTQRQYNLSSAQARAAVRTGELAQNPEQSLWEWALSEPGQKTLVQMGVLAAGSVVDIATAGKYRQLVAQGKVKQLPMLLQKAVLTVSAAFQGAGASIAGQLTQEGELSKEETFDMARENALWTGGISALHAFAIRGGPATKKFFSEGAQALMKKLNINLLVSQQNKGQWAMLAQTIKDTAFAFNPGQEKLYSTNIKKAAEYVKRFADSLVESTEIHTLGRILSGSLKGDKEIWNLYMKKAYKHQWKLMEQAERYEARVITNKKYLKTNRLDTDGQPIFKEYLERKNGHVLVAGGVATKGNKKLSQQLRKELGPETPDNSSLHGYLKKVEDLPDMVSVQEANALRTQIADFIDSPTNALQRIMNRQRTLIKNQWTKGIDDSMLGHSDEAKRFHAVLSQQYKEGADKYYSELARTIAKVRPSAIYSAIVSKDSPDLIEDFVKIFGEGSDELKQLGGYFIHDLLAGNTVRNVSTGLYETSAKGMLAGMNALGKSVTNRLLPGKASKDLQQIIELLQDVSYKPEKHLFSFVLRGAQYAGPAQIASAVFLDTGSIAGGVLTFLAPEILGVMVSNPIARKLLIDGLRMKKGSAAALAGGAKLIQKWNLAYEEAIDKLTPLQRETMQHRLQILDEMAEEEANVIPEVLS